MGPSSRERRRKQSRELHLGPAEELVEGGLGLNGQRHGSPRGPKHHHCSSQNLARQLLLLQDGLVPGRVGLHGTRNAEATHLEPGVRGAQHRRERLSSQ